MIKLLSHNLDKEDIKRFATRVDVTDREINREIYYTKSGSILTRTLHLRKIDSLLQTVGFKNYAHVTLGELFEDFVGGTSCIPYTERVYYNQQNTRVIITPRHICREFYRSPDSLEIEVSKEGNFEDYIWTCNLFRKFFGLEERVAEEK